MRIETDRLILREFREEDYWFFCKMETDEHTIEYEADSPPSQEKLHESFNRMLAGLKQKEKVRHVFLVVRKEDNVPMGEVVIWQKNKTMDEWEMGWVIYRDYIGRGYAGEAARALIGLGFQELGANRICANCNAANLASERVMQKVCMTKEGVLRETRKLKGKWYGSCIYSILRREYEAKHG